MNARLHWIPETGSHFYFFVNQAIDTSCRIILSRATAIGNLAYLFVI